MRTPDLWKIGAWAFAFWLIVSLIAWVLGYG